MRWENRCLHDDANGQGLILDAILVQECTADGQAGQSIIEHLASIEAKFLFTKAKDMRAFHQGLFWVNVDKKLKGLKLDPELRVEIEATIAEKVPRPNPDWALWGVTCIPRMDP